MSKTTAQIKNEIEKLINELELGEFKRHIFTDLSFNYRLKSFEDEDYFEFDVNLLDNLQFSELIVSTQELYQEALTLFPNPTNGQITVLQLSEASSLVLRDIHGKELQRMEVNGSEAEMDLGPLANGYYLLTVEYKNQAPVSHAVVKTGAW